MIQLRRWSQNPSGQVLLATLLFCFIFIALFVGLYKSGLLYSAKERAIRAANLTALSAGAVYCNGMQVVRVSNVIVFAIAIGNVALLATGVGELIDLGSILTFDFNPLKLVEEAQNAQKILFGINTTIPGLYPLLIWTETLSITSQNGLKNTWPGLNPLSWSIPTSIPSPILLFNIASISLETLEAIKPDMALKFRDGSFLAIPNAMKLYKMNLQGTEHIYTANQVEVAPNSNGAKYRVKKGSGLPGEGLYVSEIKIPGSDKLNKIATMLNTLSAMKLDVIDRDAPPLHNIFFYGAYPTTVSDPNGKNAEIQTLTQVSISGSGLAMWNISDPPYVTTLASTDPIELFKETGLNSLFQQLLQAGKLPSLNDLFGKALDGII